MHNHQSFGELKAAARKGLEGNYGRAIAVYISVQIFNLVPSYVILFFFSGNNLFQIIISEIVRFILLAFLQVLQIGVCLFYLKLNCGQPASSIDLFYGFHTNRNQTLGISLVFTAISYLCQLPAMIAFYNAAVSFYMYTFLQLAGILAAALFLLPFQQSYYALLDFPNLSVREALQRSAKLMRGSFLRYILFSLSFLPLILLSLLSCGIGLLWVMPYMEASLAAFYLELARNPKNQGNS